MKLDPKKTARQKLCFQRWLDNLKTSTVKAGVIIGATGFGKTFIAIMAILDMNQRHPDRNTVVVVPTTKLKDDWTREKQVFNEQGELVEDFGHIKKHGLINVQVLVVNTYTKYLDWTCDFLILDEAHHYAGINSKYFSTVIKITKYRFGLALSATIDKKQQEYLEELGWNIVDTVDEEECEQEGFTSSSITYNLGIPLSPNDKKFNEDINETFKYYFNKFDFEFEICRACNVGDNVPVFAKTKTGTNLGCKTGKQWREWWATRKNWDGKADHSYSPQNISKYAAQAMYTMRRRKDMWQNMPSKLEYIKELCEKFSYLKTIVFSETSDFADKVAELFPGKALPYHTNLLTLAVRESTTGVSSITEKKIIGSITPEEKRKLKAEGFQIKGKKVLQREAIELFQDPSSQIKIISTVRALDEGFDVKKIEFVLQAAYNSTERQDTQRNGRGKRIDYDNLDKKTLIVNLYMIGTQEEKWLRAKQASKRMIRWVTSIDEINLKTISLYGGPSIKTGTISTISSGG